MRRAIITVHGTADADLVEGRIKWWQPGSDFERTMLGCLEGAEPSSAFAPFVWSGANSERARRAASRGLLKRIRQYEADGQPYHLIGHSHGGNVILEALLCAASRKQTLDNLQSVTTVGTPFFEYAWRRGSYRRMLKALFALRYLVLAFVIAMVVLTVAFELDPFYKTSPNNVDVAHGLTSIGLFFLVLQLPGIVLIVGVASFVWMSFVGRGDRFPKRARKRAAALASRWQELWHQDDEAISALGLAKTVRPSIFRTVRLSNILASLAATTGVLALTVSAASASWALISANLFVLGSLVGAPGLRWLHVSEGAYLWGFDLAKALAIAAVACLAMVPLAKVLFDWIFRFTVGAWLDESTAGILRQNAYGNDVLSEQVRRVSATPLHESRYAPLPGELGAQLTEKVDRAAGVTIGKLRAVLGAAFLSGRPIDTATDLTAPLTWDELIHTSYFDNEHFAKLTAFGMAKLSNKLVSAHFEADPDYARIGAWYEQIERPVVPR